MDANPDFFQGIFRKNPVPSGKDRENMVVLPEGNRGILDGR
jgi:hypothetical protein